MAPASTLLLACTYLLAVFCCATFAYEEISIVNFRKVPNSGKADANTISFAFEVDPSINYGGPLTYDIEFHWEEELRCYSGSSSSYYYRARDYYSRTCQEHGNLRRKGQTYQFSVSKRGLGSGPLYVNVSVSLLCNSSYSSSYYYYYYYCYSSCQRWQFKGQSYTIKTDTIHGSIAAFEVDLELWPGEECHEFDMALPASKVEGVLLSAIKKNTNAPTANLGIYNSHYLCIRKNFVTMRGVIMKANDSLATAVRDTLNTWLSEQGSSVVIGDRQVGIRPGLCGLALSTVNDPVCGRDYPTLASSTPPNTSQNTQSGSSSSLAKDVESLKISLVSVCFVCGGLLIAITILAAYVLYRRWRRKTRRIGGVVASFSNTDEDDESGNLVFREN